MNSGDKNDLDDDFDDFDDDFALDDDSLDDVDIDDTKDFAVDGEWDDFDESNSDTLPPPKAKKKKSSGAIFNILIAAVVLGGGYFAYTQVFTGGSGSNAPSDPATDLNNPLQSASLSPEQIDPSMPPMPEAAAPDSNNAVEPFVPQEEDNIQQQAVLDEPDVLTPLPELDDEEVNLEELLNEEIVEEVETASLDQQSGSETRIIPDIDLGTEGETIKQEIPDVDLGSVEPIDAFNQDISEFEEIEADPPEVPENAFPAANVQSRSLDQDNSPAARSETMPENRGEFVPQQYRLSEEDVEDMISLRLEQMNLDNDVNLTAIQDQLNQISQRLDQFETRMEKKIGSELNDLRNQIAQNVNDAGAAPARQVSKPEEKPKPETAAAPKNSVSKPSVETKPSSQVASKKPAASPSSWELRSAQPGQATISQKGSGDLRVVEVGQTVQGIGRILSISKVDGKWQVEGTQATVLQ